jgi:hypothetical protein
VKLGRKQKAGDDIPRRRKAAYDGERPSAADLSSRYTFRRNRTLTGSSSPDIASSTELTADIRSPRAHAHHLTRLRRKLALFLGIVIVGAFALYLLISQLVATVSIQVADTSLLPASDKAAYTAAIERYYAARPSERLRFLLNAKDFTSNLQAARPEIKSASVEPGSTLSQAIVSIVPRIAIARWSLGGTDRFVDADGVVFLRNYGTPPSLQIVDESGIPSGNNQIVASNRFLSFVGHIVNDAAQSGYTVVKVTLPPLTTRELDIQLKGDKTTYKLSVDRAAGEQVEDMARVKRYLLRHQVTPSYVDLRIAGKAFYR